ncbi:MAG: WYL domain-containing protein [Blastochloris sp.]|nr:WYL domain-containing protein [Blastochloris sp.]
MQRALARQGLVVQNAPTPTLASRGDSTAAQIAVACARDAQTAPADAPLRPTPTLVQQLREQLPAPLRAQVDAALTAPPPSPLPIVAAPRTIADGRQTRRVLERAVRRQHAVTLTYDTGAQGQWSQREVRPVALEQQGSHWYLRAWCTARQDERVFRLDRIGAVVPRE